jgi:hypothetical protein
MAVDWQRTVICPHRAGRARWRPIRNGARAMPEGGADAVAGPFVPTGQAVMMPRNAHAYPGACKARRDLSAAVSRDEPAILDRRRRWKHIPRSCQATNVMIAEIDPRSSNAESVRP